MASVSTLARRLTRSRRRQPARCVVENRDRAGGKSFWRYRVFPIRSTVAALPAMGDAGGGLESVATRHSYPPALRPLARLSRSTRFRAGSGTGSEPYSSASLRSLSRSSLPLQLSGAGRLAIRISDSSLPRPPKNQRRPGRLHAGRLQRPKRLSGRQRLSLQRGTAAFSYGCPQSIEFLPRFCCCRTTESGVCDMGWVCFVLSVSGWP